MAYAEMPDKLQDSLIKDLHLDNFFSQFSWAFLNFAAEHHLRVDKYWHDFPPGGLVFGIPKEGRLV